MLAPRIFFQKKSGTRNVFKNNPYISEGLPIIIVVMKIVMEIEKFADYLKLERNYSDCTISGYRKDLELFHNFFVSLDHNLTFQTVDNNIVRAWIVELMKSGQATTTVNRKLSTLRSFYKFLMMNGCADHSPVTLIKGPKNKKPLPVFVRESEMDRLLDDDSLFGEGFDAVLGKTIIETFYQTGIRLAELLGLTVSSVDFSAGTIKVLGKRNKERYIPFGEELKNQFEKYLEQRNSIENISTSSFFVTEKGEPLPRHKVYALVKNLLTKVSTVTKKSPHVLRHTFATAMLNNNADLSSVKEILGHASLAATQVYTHTTLQELKDIYKHAHPRA